MTATRLDIQALLKEIAPLTAEERKAILLRERDALVSRLNSIRAQLEDAQLAHIEFGEKSDYGWRVRANHARRVVSVQVGQLQTAIAEANRELKNESRLWDRNQQREFGGRFVIAAKRILDSATYQRICAAANATE